MESQSEQPRVTTEVYSSQKKVNQGLMEAIHFQKNSSDKPLEKHGEQSNPKATALSLSRKVQARQIRSLNERVVALKFMVTVIFLLTFLNIMLTAGLWKGQ